jgi:hypothetical protein
MKYNQSQLEMIAIMFKIQYGDKTVAELFPQIKNDPILKIELCELEICKPRTEALYKNDIDLRHNGVLKCYFSQEDQKFLICGFGDLRFKIDDIVKMLNFEDKI